MNHHNFFKKGLIIILFIIGSQGIFGQVKDTFYYDQNWRGCDKSIASFYRVVTLSNVRNNNTYRFQPIGPVTDYYITGAVQSQINEAIEIDIKDDRRSKFKGKTVRFYKSGKKSSESIYDNYGQIISNINWPEINSMVEFTSPQSDGKFETQLETCIISGEIKDGKRFGAWTMNKGGFNKEQAYYFNGQLTKYIYREKDKYGNELSSKIIFKTKVDHTGIIFIKGESIGYGESSKKLESYLADMNNSDYGANLTLSLFHKPETVDSSYGVKKNSDVNFEDKNGGKYDFGYTEFISNEKTHGFKFLDHVNSRMIYFKLLSSRVDSYKFDDMNHLVEINSISALNKLRKSDLFISQDTGKNSTVKAFAKKNAEGNINYQMYVDNKIVLEGEFDSVGNRIGKWRSYYFSAYINSSRKSLAVVYNYRTIYNELINGSNLSLLVLRNPKTVKNSDIEQIENLSIDKILNAMKFGLQSAADEQQILNSGFEIIQNPYSFTKYGTIKKEKDKVNLVDVQSYHIYQRFEFNQEGGTLRAYQYNPEGKAHDSLIYAKDEFGETFTKENRKFNTFPDHPMRKQVEKNVNAEINSFLSTLKSNTTTPTQTCKLCNGNVKNPVKIDEIKCGDVGYILPRLVFCSNKCRFEFESGYCRDK